MMFMVDTLGTRAMDFFLFPSIDISTSVFPTDYFDRQAIYFQNHDQYNHPIRLQLIFAQ